MPATTALKATTDDEDPLVEIERIRAELARRDLRTFIEMVWHIVEPDVPMLWNWHLDDICAALQDVTAGKIMRLLMNIPPGTMKSLIVSVFWPAWEWATHPGLRYLTGSYGSHLSIRDNLKVREIVTSDWYRTHFALRLIPDQNEKTLFKTTAKGWRFATSVGGAGTGEHPDRIIIDDPHTAAQAASEADRSAAHRWFSATISSRGKARNARIVVVMQRLHEDDLSGYLLAKGGWTHIRFPMRYEANAIDHAGVRIPPDPRDRRKVEGELLWPALFNEAAVRSWEIENGEQVAAGQLQQRPAPIGGGLFKRHWFQVVDAAPANGPRCRGWDVAATEGSGDWTVGVRVCGPVDGIWYVEDVERGQWGPAEVQARMEATAQRDGRAVRIREEREPGSSGVAVIAARARILAGFDYGKSEASGNKEVRARPFRAQCEAGNVRLVRGSWNEAYIAEHCVFPTGSHDDQVDAGSTAFNELAGGPRPMRRVATAWG